MNKIESGARKSHGDAIYEKTWSGKYWGWNGVLVLATIRLLWWIVTFRAGRGLCATASSFYSAASNTRKKGGPKTALDRLKFAFAGSVAVALASLCLLSRFGQIRWCSASELDVLGTIFSRAGQFWLARKISGVVEEMFGVGDVSDHTMALVLKWKMLDPKLKPEARDYHKYLIRALMQKNPQWEPQVKARLYEALGDKESEAVERAKIRRQFG